MGLGQEDAVIGQKAEEGSVMNKSIEQIARELAENARRMHESALRLQALIEKL